MSKNFTISIKRLKWLKSHFNDLNSKWNTSRSCSAASSCWKDKVPIFIFFFWCLHCYWQTHAPPFISRPPISSSWQWFIDDSPTSSSVRYYNYLEKTWEIVDLFLTARRMSSTFGVRWYSKQCQAEVITQLHFMQLVPSNLGKGYGPSYFHSSLCVKKLLLETCSSILVCLRQTCFVKAVLLL